MASFLELKEKCFSVRVWKQKSCSFMAPRFIVACSRYLYHRLTRTHLSRGRGGAGVGLGGEGNLKKKYLGSIEV